MILCDNKFTYWAKKRRESREKKRSLRSRMSNWATNTAIHVWRMSTCEIIPIYPLRANKYEKRELCVLRISELAILRFSHNGIWCFALKSHIWDEKNDDNIHTHTQLVQPDKWQQANETAPNKWNKTGFSLGSLPPGTEQKKKNDVRMMCWGNIPIYTQNHRHSCTVLALKEYLCAAVVCHNDTSMRTTPHEYESAEKKA